MAASRMATSIESILSGLLVPDNVIIAQATQELRKLFKDPNIIEHLLEVLCVSQNIQVRQYSAILLRKKIFRLKAWRKLPEDKRNELKRVLLLRITCEQEKAVVLAVGQLVAVVAKHECQTGRWTELQDFLNLLMNSKNVEECRLGFYIVSVVSSEASEIFLGHGKQLFNLFGSCLQSFADEHLCFYVIKSMTALVSSLDSDDAICFQALIPYVLEVIRRLVKVSEEKATEALEIFDELIDAKISILLPHIKPLVTMCLKIASDSKNGDMLRVRAMSVLSWMISVKKKTIVKHKLIPEILEALFPIMADVSHGELDSEIEDEDDEMHCQSPSACAAQLIDAMALHLPPEKLLPPLSQLTEKYLASDSPVQKRAAFLAIAFIAEGCSEAIRQKHLPMFVHIICRGVVYEEVFVRNAALFALGQFADFLQPEILKYASEIVPILLNHLGQTAEQMAHTGRDPPNLTKTFYALETFCENLEGELVTYLPAVMERVLVFLTAPTCRARELAISAIGSIACATEEAMLPYFPHIIGNLKQYLTEHQSGHNATLRAQAVDTLGCLARTMGATNFLPKAEDCVQLGLRLIDAVDDPDLRRSTFGMFAAVSSVLRADMTKYLEPILDHMFTSLRSTEGVVTQPVNAVGHGLELFEGLEESEDEAAEIDISGEGDTSDDDDDDSEQGYTVENAYLEEKEDTCVTLENLAGNIGPAFAPYLEKCFTEVLPMASHPASNVRKAALSCIGQLTVMLFKSAGDSVTIEDVSEAAGILIPKLVEIGHTDPDRDVVLTTLETLALLINELKGAAFESPSHVNDIVNLVKDAFNDKLASQDADSDGEDAEEQDEAEYDGLLVQMAGQLVPALAKALPAETFAPYLAGLLPLFLGKLKKQNSPSDRSYAVGTLAEVAEGLGKEGIGPFCKPLLPVFLASMQDQDSEVRSNAVFGLGILIQNAPDILAPEYPSLLGALHSMLSQEDNRHAKDNICGAVARLILVGANSIPMGMVFPVLLQQLPLEEDFEENVSVFQCICYLYGCKRQELIQNLPSILRLILRVIGTDQVNADTRLSLVHLLKSMSSDFPNEVQQILQACTPQERETFNAVLTSS